MIRLFRHHGRFLLLLAIGYQQLRREESGGQTAVRAEFTRQIGHWISANPTNPVATYISTFDWIDAFSEGERDFDELTGTIYENLASQDTNSKGDVSLISTIVDMLGLPWTGNRIGSETIQALRRAILRPSELEGFRKASRETFCCSVCSHKFGNDEAAVVRRETDNAIVVQCLRCRHPRTGVCANCGEAAAISGANLEAMKAAKYVTCDCGTQKWKKKVLAEAVADFRNEATGRPISPRARTAMAAGGRASTIMANGPIGVSQQEQEAFGRGIGVELRGNPAPPPGAIPPGGGAVPGTINWRDTVILPNAHMTPGEMLVVNSFADAVPISLDNETPFDEDED